MTDRKTPHHQEPVLPDYLHRCADGVFLDAAGVPPGTSLVEFVDRFFASGVYFTGLDYARLMQALYDDELPQEQIRIAQDIARFVPQRQALYKGVKISGDGQSAEFMFEPVSMETAVDEPVYGLPGEDGVAPVTGYKHRMVKQATRLDFDEFVADMWLKGVRFGIEADKVRQAIDKGELRRMQIAALLPPGAGSDAEIVEAGDALHRDNSPKLLPDGRANLRRFSNRFPHVARGAPLLKKIPRVMPRPGRKVTGEIIISSLPKDLDLHALVGPGTHVERTVEGEIIVADLDGFLTLDISRNLISITETIENHSGISLRTTGDLTLSVDEFVEHGEVQEGRLVEGRHMTFKSAVYGDIRSLEGVIRIEANLSGGSARSTGGDVLVNGRASNAIVEAADGRVAIQFAEGCTVIGKTVEIERAISCQIVAGELRLGLAEGCGIVAQSIALGSSNARKHKETVLTAVVPDLAAHDQRILDATEAAARISAAMEGKLQAIRQTQDEPELKKYLALSAQVRQGKLTLNDAQKEQVRKLTAKFTPTLQMLRTMEVERQNLLGNLQAAGAEVERLKSLRSHCGDGLHCEIREVLGSTVVQTFTSNDGLMPFRSMSVSELKARSHQISDPTGRLFSDDSGSFSWKFSVPDTAD